MRYWRVCAFLILTAAFSFNASAATLAQQRAAFKSIASDIQDGDLQGVPQRIRALKGYVLYPYLRYAYLKARLKKGDQVDGAVERFLKRWKDLPVADQLREHWLRQLAQREDWQSFHKHYRPTSEPHLRCDAVVARLKLEQAQKAAASDKALRKAALNLWMTGRDQPKACDPAFKWLDKTGALTPARYQARIDLALDRGQTHLAKYLAKNQTGKARKRTMRRIAMDRHPDRELSRLQSHHDAAMEPGTVVNGLLLLARSQPSEAADLYKPLAAAYKLSKAQRQSVVRDIALGYALNRQPQAMDWLSRLSGDQVNETVRAWRIRAALYQQDWDAALAWLDKLPPDEAATPRWRYWRARVLGQQGYPGQARKIYRQLVQGDGYYAWLAASRLGLRYHPHSKAVALHSATLKQLEGKPGIIRARELFMVGWYKEARAEWRQALSGEAPAVWRQSGVLAQQWGWHSEAIISLANGGIHEDLAVSYPMAYRKQVLPQSRKHSINAAWLYGVIRTESLFMPDALSRAGARGLMQLLPGTAREVARHEGVALPGMETLYDTGLNVRLGSRYLKRLLARFDGNVVLATAAYNAGPSRVDTWVPDKTLPADIWVENIPYTETRHYVKRVLGYTIMFEWRLHHHIEPAAQRMPPVGTAEPADVPAQSG